MKDLLFKPRFSVVTIFGSSIIVGALMNRDWIAAIAVFGLTVVINSIWDPKQ